MEVKAIVNTVIKKDKINSSQLSSLEKMNALKGSKFTVQYAKDFGSHKQVKLENGEIWYFYTPHWKGFNKTFPTGQLMPYIKDNPSRQDVIDSIIDYSIDVGVTKISHIAYILSTAEGESNFKPIKEFRGTRLTSDQERYWHTGFYGRGMIQVTWRSNYLRVGEKLGLNLVLEPNLLLTYPVSIASLVLGMRDGWYTGRKLDDYKDYSNMRRIVNPGEIRAYPSRARKFVENAAKWESYLESNRLKYGLKN